MRPRSPIELVLLSIFLPLAPLMFAVAVGVALFLPLRSSPTWLSVAALVAFVSGLLGTVVVAHRWFPPSRAFARGYLALASLAGLVVFSACAHAIEPLTLEDHTSVPTAFDFLVQTSVSGLAYGGMCVGTLVALWAKRRDFYG